MIEEEYSSDEEIVTSSIGEKSPNSQEQEKQGDDKSLTEQDLRRTKITKMSKSTSKTKVISIFVFDLYQLNTFKFLK